jgi:uncharacterized protein YdaU (DUF1376 family)
MSDEKDPWHKRYHSDALTGYRGLNLEQRGAYTTILDLLYDAGEETLAPTDRWMAGQLDVSVRKWRTLRDELQALGKLIVYPDGRISNKRYLRELGKRRALSAKRAEAGAKGGKSSGKQPERDLFDDSSTPENELKTTGKPEFSTPVNAAKVSDNFRETPENTNENNDSEQASASVLPPVRARVPDTRYQKPDSKKIQSPLDSLETRDEPEPETDWNALDLLAVTQQLCDLAGISLIMPAKLPPQMDVVKDWKRRKIDLAAVVVPIIERTRLNNPDQPVYSLAYFDTAIATALSRSGTRKRAGIDDRPKPPAKPPEPQAPPLAVDDVDDAQGHVWQIRKCLKPVTGYDQLLRSGQAAMSINGVGLVVTCRSDKLAAEVRTRFGKAIGKAAEQVLGSPAFEVRAQ